MLPKDRAGGLRFEVTICDHLPLHISIFCVAAAAPGLAYLIAMASREVMSLSTALCAAAAGRNLYICHFCSCGHVFTTTVLLVNAKVSRQAVHISSIFPAQVIGVSTTKVAPAMLAQV